MKIIIITIDNFKVVYPLFEFPESLTFSLTKFKSLKDSFFYFSNTYNWFYSIL